MKEFTKKLAEFFKEQLDAPEDFCREIEECEDFDDIHAYLEESEELKELVGFNYMKKEMQEEIDDLEEEKSDLEGELRDYEGQVSELEDELEKKFNPVTYWDEERYKLFLKHHTKFTPTEFEELLTKVK